MSKRFAFTSAVACALAAVTAVALAPHAKAAGPTITIASPLHNAFLTDPAIRIQGEARMPSGGTVNGELRVDVESLDGRGTQGIAANVNGNPVPFNWTYNAVYNGRYRVVVTAHGRDGAIDTTPSERSTQAVDVTVEVKPVPPADVKATANAAREVVVTWKANPEPDTLGYQVQRKHEDDGDWAPAGNTSATTFTDTATTSKGGQYEYQVVAFRSGALAGSAVVSDASSVRTVDVANPPGTTSTTERGGSGGNNGGTGGNTGSTGAGGTNANGGSGGSGGTLATTGKVDLSGFAGLLEDARASGGSGPGGNRPAGAEEDGFDETLPFKPGEAEALGEDGTALAIGVEEAGEQGAGSKPIAFVAASLLVTVILMHVLWLKREVDKVPLEAVTE